MRIITFNANGLRSAAKKDFFGWFSKQKADVLCIQETKAQEEQLIEANLLPSGYHAYFCDAEKKGYSGVALLSLTKPDKVQCGGLGWHSADTEGRYLQADFGKLSIISLYMPSGTSGEERQNVKYDFMKHFRKHLEHLKSTHRQYIICGDWNIAHKEIDLKNWKGNQKNSGFLPEERAWLDELFGKGEFVDAFRVVNQESEQYTWWTQRSPTAFAKNIGWRIDYQIVTPNLKNKILDASIYKEKQFSDHAPLIMDYDLTF